MRTLVIDTATRACSVALYDGAHIIASHYEVIGRGHAERLLPLIAELPNCGKSDQVVVNVGPGSFTGIRVGVAAARALGLAWGVPVIGYGSLNLVAAMARAEANDNNAIDVVMSGGHGEYFCESFDSNGVSQAQVVSLTPVEAAKQSFATTVAGDVAADVVAKRGDGVVIDLLPDASSWHLISSVPALPASPIYGRAPDAKLPKGKAE
ncbi:MAG: tRNA (adenosine(37)-N6)-threonylcarbamoyltransferase complex dimerization subunit type 1 TsaB [Sphingorhabdus sp.]